MNKLYIKKEEKVIKREIGKTLKELLGKIKKDLLNVFGGKLDHYDNSTVKGNISTLSMRSVKRINFYVVQGIVFEYLTSFNLKKVNESFFQFSYVIYLESGYNIKISTINDKYLIISANLYGDD